MSQETYHHSNKQNELGEHALTADALDSVIKDDADKPLSNEQLSHFSEDDVDAILAARNTRKKIGIKPQEL